MLDEADRLLALPHAERVPVLGALLDSWGDGRIKLIATTAGLRMRRADPALFLAGSYEPLEADLSVPSSAVAFARVHGDSAAIFVAPRLCRALVDADLRPPLGGDKWKTSRVLLPPALAGRSFRHEVTGAEIQPTTGADRAWIFLGQVFEHVPLGMLRAI
jgi:(1->4)-alpha-D-glucan 1-alpha-D-glucosylmutase